MMQHRRVRRIFIQRKEVVEPVLSSLRCQQGLNRFQCSGGFRRSNANSPCMSWRTTCPERVPCRGHYLSFCMRFYAASTRSRTGSGTDSSICWLARAITSPPGIRLSGLLLAYSLTAPVAIAKAAWARANQRTPVSDTVRSTRGWRDLNSRFDIGESVLWRHFICPWCSA